MKCVILGGGGFLGSYLSKELLRNGSEVSIFDQSNARNLDDLGKLGSKIIIGNFLDIQDIRSAISDCDVIFHLISFTNPKTSMDNPKYDVETNIIGTVQLLQEASKIGIKKVIYSSSGGTVYGIPVEIPIKETHPTDPINFYAVSKLMIEKYLNLFKKLYGLDYGILRIANAYGERQPVTNNQGLIASLIDKVLQKNVIEIFGDGTNIRDYVHAEDVAKAFVKVAQHDGEQKIFNIGGGMGSSINDVIMMIENITGKNIQIQHLPERSFDVPVNYLDISKAKKHLDWEPAISLREGILRTYQWMIAQPENPQ